MESHELPEWNAFYSEASEVKTLFLYKFTIWAMCGCWIFVSLKSILEFLKSKLLNRKFSILPTHWIDFDIFHSRIVAATSLI